MEVFLKSIPDSLASVKEVTLSQETEKERASEGHVKRLFVLSLPVFILLFSASLLGFLERVWSSRYSLETLEASVSAIYILRFFQLPCIGITMMGQIFVGHCSGSGKEQAIGTCVWQLIWFSFLSMGITLPLSFLAAHVFFDDVLVKQEILPYFFMLAGGNFLFPLVSALSSFYLGREKIKKFLIATLLAQALNGILDFILIFGLDPWIAPMGLKGAAIATLVSQGLLALLLFSDFLRPLYRERYGTGNWTFSFPLFWRFFSVSSPRAFGRLISLSIWACTSHVMSSKGGPFLLVLSVGGVVTLFLLFIGDGLSQALVILMSHAVGAKRFADIRKHFRHGLVALCLIAPLLAIPLVLFPDKVISLFALSQEIQTAYGGILRESLFWTWIYTINYIFSSILLSVLLATKQISFLLLAHLSVWFLSFSPVYIGFTYLDVGPEKFWLFIGCGTLSLCSIYLWRIFKKGLLSDSAVSPKEDKGFTTLGL